MSMKFVFPKTLPSITQELIIKMYEEKLDSIEIPHSNGQILIKSDSNLVQKKFDDESISIHPFSVPLEDQTSVSFYICCPR
jgi:uncharacterized protein with PIN domain